MIAPASRIAALLGIVALVAGCGDDDGVTAMDSGVDAARPDAGARDSSFVRRDAGPPPDAPILPVDAGAPVDANLFCSPARLPCGPGLDCCSGLACVSGICTVGECGASGEICDATHPCCPGAACVPSSFGGFVCEPGMCTPAMAECGGPRPACCAGLICGRAPAPLFMACVTCLPAGSPCGAGAMCCPGNLCRPDAMTGRATCS